MQPSSTSSFSRFAKFLGTILIVLLSIGLIFNYAFERIVIFSGEIGGAAKINRIIKVDEAGEIPIFGSSRAQGSFVPSILGEAYFNYGIDGTQMNILGFFLKKELQKDKSGPILINFDLVGFRSSYGDLGNYIPNYPETREIIEADAKFYYHLPLIKYFGKYESYLKYRLNEKLNITKHTDRGGSFEKNVLTEKIFAEMVERRRNTADQFRIEVPVKDAFEKLVDATDRPIFLIIAPYHPSYFHKFEGLAQAQAYLAQMQARPHVQVLDFSQEVYADSLFTNTTHLNYEGAIKFTEALKKEMHAISNPTP
ncbi:MAG: hypothetical protein AAFR61_20200 [Bacteroidota bacterium]